MRLKFLLIILLIGISGINFSSGLIIEESDDRYSTNQTDVEERDYSSSKTKQIPLATSSNSDFEYQSSTKKSYQRKPNLKPHAINSKSNSISILSASPNPINWNQPLTITGTLKGGGGDPWVGETIRLYQDIDFNINDVGTYIIDDTTTTTGGGVYTFTVNFVIGDIGQHNYTIFYPGDGEFREAGIVEREIGFEVLDTATITFASDKVTVGPPEQYTVTVTITTASGRSTDQLQVYFTEDVGALPKDGLENVVAGVASYSNNYGISQVDTITISASVTGWGNIPYISIPANPANIQISVTLDYIFTFTGTIDADTLNSSRFYRNDQTLFFFGNISAANPTNATQESIDVTGKIYSITFSGAGFSGSTINGVTNTKGEFNYTILLSTTNFPNVWTSPITVTANVIPAGLTIPTTSRQITINLQEDIDSFDTTFDDIDVNAFYFPGSGSVTVSGTLNDSNNLDVQGVQVNAKLNNKISFGQPWNGSIVETNAGSSTTNATGGFSITIPIPDFLSSSRRLTVNLSLTVPVGGKWNDPNALTVEFQPFIYFRSLIFTVLKDIGGGQVPVVSGNTYDTFNNTFANYLRTGAVYNVTIMDEFNRRPDGVLVDFTGIHARGGGATTGPSAVSAANKGSFEVSFATLNDSSQSFIQSLGLDGSSYLYQIVMGTGTIQETVEETYTLFGPDEVGPKIQSVDAIGNNTGSPDDIQVLVRLDETQSSSAHNIKNVTLFYRYSDNNHSALVGDAVFSGSFTAVIMDYEGLYALTYNFTLYFGGHGRWVEYYVFVYDLAGQGLNAAGITYSATNQYNASETFAPDYDSAFSRTDNKFFGDSHKDKMGDTSINSLDPVENYVYVESENNALSSVITASNFTFGDNITIILELPVDVSNYSSVIIFWRVRTYNVTLDDFDPFSSWYNDSMIFMNRIVNDRYNFTVANSFLDWFTQLDYYFNVTDNADNFVTTLSILGSTSPSTWVQDEDPPEESSQADYGEYPKGGDDRDDTGNQYEVWNNETMSVTHNVTDSGVGIYNVNVTYYYTYPNATTSSYTEQLVVNGTDQKTGQQVQVASNYLANIDFNFTGYENGTTISYEVTVEDKAGNVEVLNDQTDPTAKLFNVDNPPEEEIPPTTEATTITQDTTIISTDAEGNVHTTTLTSGQVIGETTDEEGDSSNALIIIIGFVGGLSLLILYYQRHNIKEVLARRARAKRVQGTLRELTDEIKRLGAEGKYKRAILLTWEALERVSREIIQAPRSYNQTAREFASYLSTVTIVDRETLLTLSASYETAKYGRDPPTHDDWDDAVKALDITVRTIIESGARVHIEEEDDDF